MFVIADKLKIAEDQFQQDFCLAVAKGINWQF
jgi:hypothetical protein